MSNSSTEYELQFISFLKSHFGFEGTDSELLDTLRFQSRHLPVEMFQDYLSVILLECNEDKVGDGRFDKKALARVSNRVAKRISYDLKKAARVVTLDEDSISEVKVTSDISLGDVHSILDTLSPEERLLLTLRYLQEQTIEQIATRLHMPKSTVDDSIRRALNRARKAI